VESAFCDAGSLRCDCGQESCLVHGHASLVPWCSWGSTRAPLEVEDLDLTRWIRESSDATPPEAGGDDGV